MTTCPSGTYPYIIRPGDSLWVIAQRFHTTIQAIMAVNGGLNTNELFIGQIICIPQENGIRPIAEHKRSQEISNAELTMSNHLRLLWEQHVFWTRLVILSMAFGLPDTELVTDRLLQNPKDFEAALKPFYGEENAGKFAELLTNHLAIAAELVKAAKAGDNTAAEDAEKRWYANADQIAAFLAGINPNWSEQEWKNMLYDHLRMTKSEAVEILTQNYSESIDTFDSIEKEALEMADMMTQGIVKQFPQYFK